MTARAGSRVTVLLVSIGLVTGAQALAAAPAGAEVSMGDICAEAIVPIDCFVDDDDTGVTAGPADTGDSDPGDYDPGDSGGNDSGTGGADVEDPGTGDWNDSGVDDGSSNGDDRGTWGHDTGDPPELDGSDYVDPDAGPLIDTDEHGHLKEPFDLCDLLGRYWLWYTRPGSPANKEAFLEWTQCWKSQAPPDPTLPSARADKRLRKLSARRRKTSRNVKRGRVARAARVSR
jgi:hypothetical protein